MFIFLLKKVPPVVFCSAICALLLLSEMLLRITIIRVPFEYLLIAASPVQQRLIDAIFFPPRAMMRSIQDDQQITSLQMEKAFLESQNAQLQYLQAENQQLKKEVELNDVYQSIFPRYQLVAKVITGPQDWSIDRGEYQGVQQYDVVLFQGIMIGVIDEVFPFFASIEMIHLGQLSVLAETTTNIQGVLIQENGRLMLTHLNPDAQIKEGDKIYTAGTAERLIPKGLYIGKVKGVQKQPSDDALVAIIDQEIEYGNIDSVIIQGFRK